MAARIWTDAQKAKQSALIHTWKPWEKSTGAKTQEGKAISAMNAHSGYFRRWVRLGRWLLWEKYHTSELTPALIAKTIVRADKLNLELPESRQHQQFLRDMAFAGMEAALTEPYRKIYGCYMTQLVISAARKLVLGKGE